MPRFAMIHNTHYMYSLGQTTHGQWTNNEYGVVNDHLTLWSKQWSNFSSKPSGYLSCEVCVWLKHYSKWFRHPAIPSLYCNLVAFWTDKNINNDWLTAMSMSACLVTGHYGIFSLSFTSLDNIMVRISFPYICIYTVVTDNLSVAWKHQTLNDARHSVIGRVIHELRLVCN